MIKPDALLAFRSVTVRPAPLSLVEKLPSGSHVASVSLVALFTT
jgi:hypothetical protein